jgi:uncharacterized protein (TIGR02453 family)
VAFTPKALAFLKGLKKNNNKLWFEAHRADYEDELREPMRFLIGEMDARMRKFAPEIGGDPKRSMFRINRDIRFSKDKSPYKTHAACWFAHRSSNAKVGQEAEGGSAGFYFHLEPGQCMVGAGLWMPPRPQVNAIRDLMVEKPKPFLTMVAGLKRFGGLDGDGATLKRMPRGYDEKHVAAKWLKYQSFTTGRVVPDSFATNAKLPALLEKEFKAMLPLVRWLNSALGY